MIKKHYFLILGSSLIDLLANGDLVLQKNYLFE